MNSKLQKKRVLKNSCLKNITSLLVNLKLVFSLIFISITCSIFIYGQSLQQPVVKAFVLPDATEGKSYNYTFQSSGGSDVYFETLIHADGIDSVLPSGLSINLAGVLSGIPISENPSESATIAQEKPYFFKVRIISNENKSLRRDQWFALKVKKDQLKVTPDFNTKNLGQTVTIPPPITHPYVLGQSTSDVETVNLTENFKPDQNPLTFLETLTSSDKNITTEVKLSATKNLFKDTFQRDPNLKLRQGDYCIVHIIQWKPLNDEHKSDPKNELWALFEKGKDINPTDNNWIPHFDAKDKIEKVKYDTRIFGSRRVIVLLIHLDTPILWDVKYKINVTQQIPTPLQDALTLIKAISPNELAEGKSETTKQIWGARMMTIKYMASKIDLQAKVVSPGEKVEQSKDYTNTYINEGKYHWDVSVGIPLKSVKDIKFTSDNNNVTTSSKDRQNVYAFVNFFPIPVDLKSEKFLTWPHLIFGLPFAGKPLQHPLVGLGYGINTTLIKFNLFSGFVFNRERVPRTLSFGDQATSSQLESDLRNRWTGKFTFGVNFPISQVKDILKGK